jgi:hypothetical protein
MVGLRAWKQHRAEEERLSQEDKARIADIKEDLAAEETTTDAKDAAAPAESGAAAIHHANADSNDKDSVLSEKTTEVEVVPLTPRRRQLRRIQERNRAMLIYHRAISGGTPPMSPVDGSVIIGSGIGIGSSSEATREVKVVECDTTTAAAQSPLSSTQTRNKTPRLNHIQTEQHPDSSSLLQDTTTEKEENIISIDVQVSPRPQRRPPPPPVVAEHHRVLLESAEKTKQAAQYELNRPRRAEATGAILDSNGSLALQFTTSYK